MKQTPLIAVRVAGIQTAGARNHVVIVRQTGRWCWKPFIAMRIVRIIHMFGYNNAKLPRQFNKWTAIHLWIVLSTVCTEIMMQCANSTYSIVHDKREEQIKWEANQQETKKQCRDANNVDRCDMRLSKMLNRQCVLNFDWHANAVVRNYKAHRTTCLNILFKLLLLHTHITLKLCTAHHIHAMT